MALNIFLTEFKYHSQKSYKINLYPTASKKATWSTARGWCIKQPVREVITGLLRALLAANKKILSFHSFCYHLVLCGSVTVMPDPIAR